MTPEQKELLLKDLCARLPYGVKALATQYRDDAPPLRDIVVTINLKNLDEFLNNSDDYDYEIKPYLFPISSMTEEQKRNLMSLFNCHIEITQYEIKFADYQDSNMDNWNKVFNWCYKNHFDINGLIPMDLADDATGLNIY